MPSDRYAVIGHPVSHSLSPTIHARFARQTGEDLEYGRLEPAEDGFGEAATAFFADGGRGLNVTVPFKAEARTWCDRVSDRASRAGVVNTLTLQANGWVAGDNTDGIGLVRDLTVNLDLGLAGTRILLIGAGGAARGEPRRRPAPDPCRRDRPRWHRIRHDVRPEGRGIPRLGPRCRCRDGRRRPRDAGRAGGRVVPYLAGNPAGNRDRPGGPAGRYRRLMRPP